MALKKLVDNNAKERIKEFDNLAMLNSIRVS